MHDAVTTFLLAFVSALASALCGYLISQIRNKTKKNKEEKDRLEKIEHGLMVLTRSDLMRLYDIFSRKGYCPMSVKTSIEEEYIAYHELGGNGIATQMYEEILALPDHPKPKKRSSKSKSIEEDEEV